MCRNTGEQLECFLLFVVFILVLENRLVLIAFSLYFDSSAIKRMKRIGNELFQVLF